MNEIDNRILAKYIFGEASAEERILVEDWMKVSPANSQEIERLQETIAFVTSHYQEDKLNTDKAWKRFSVVSGVSRRLHLYRNLCRVADIVLLVILSGVTIWMIRPQKDWVVINASRGKQLVYLPDSTEITLAVNSSIRYDRLAYNKEVRQVEMNGKAFFEVRKNKSCPFIVDMKSTEVEVLGTAFQVDIEDEDTEVRVERGKVAFSVKDRKDKAILTAGMSATYINKENMIRETGQEDTNGLAWVTGVLRFSNTPLSKVIATLENYYQVDLTQESISDKQLTAVFDNQPLTDVLEIINETLDVKLKTKD